MKQFTNSDLYSFVALAQSHTYAGGGKYVENPEREGFNELTFNKESFSYRDSYVGYLRSWGSEVVRWDNQPVWNTVYGGGMVSGKEELSKDCFEFLQTCLSSKDVSNQYFRGPSSMERGEWGYFYTQSGSIEQFEGSEYITFKKEKVFTHKIIGGLIIGKNI